jgi:hypothetical protein
VALRFVMYTEKSVAQAMNAINERLHTPGTKSRPQLDGWVEKSGRFSMCVTSNVRWRLRRKTYLQGKAEKLGGITLLQGTVPGGVGTQGMLVIFGALVLLAILVYTQGNALLAAAALVAGLVLYVPLVGDYQNCETLLAELQKAVNAKFTPPSGKSTTSTATASSAARRPAASPQTAAKPAARITKAKPATTKAKTSSGSAQTKSKTTRKTTA